MDVNALPTYDKSDSPTGCCPRFSPEGWDEQELHFVDKPFVRATTRSLFHIPLNMGSVFKKVFAAVEAAEAGDDHHFIVLSRDLSPWTCEHCFSVTKPVPGLATVQLSGDYLTKVFEGHYKNVADWEKVLVAELAQRGRQVERTYFFYTTCPRCAKFYGENYVIGVAKV